MLNWNTLSAFVRGLAVLGCLFIAGIACGAEVTDVAVDGLPPKVYGSARHWCLRSEILQAWMVIVDGKRCFVLRMTCPDEKDVQEIYVSPDGKFMGRKDEPFSVKNLPELLFALAILSLVPGGIGAFLGRFMLRSNPVTKWSRLLEWWAAWGGAYVAMALVVAPMTRVTTVYFTDSLFSFVFVAGISASVIETVILGIQSVRKLRTAPRAWLLTFCLAGAAFLVMSSLAEIHLRSLQDDRTMALALRPIAQEVMEP